MDSKSEPMDLAELDRCLSFECHSSSHVDAHWVVVHQDALHDDRLFLTLLNVENVEGGVSWRYVGLIHPHFEIRTLIQQPQEFGELSRVDDEGRDR
jgi:hypothetical protein